ncbi:hypothetical protein JW977_01140 [Candidatus Falkowbacteria bacterium]|nr:hypothetical protein [Candidatus Falkowbacteria bacterium]
MKEKGGGVSDKCLKCGAQLISQNGGFCGQCIKEIFRDSKIPVFFCKKCKKSHPLSPLQLRIAIQEAKVQNIPKGGLIMLISDSCSECHRQGDSEVARFSFLKPILLS